MVYTKGPQVFDACSPLRVLTPFIPSRDCFVIYDSIFITRSYSYQHIIRMNGVQRRRSKLFQTSFLKSIIRKIDLVAIMVEIVL